MTMKVNNMTNYRKSNEIKKGIRRKMREGKVWLNCSRFLGYTKDENGHLVIVEDEAKIVRKIFELYLNGLGGRKIKKYLEENSIASMTIIDEKGELFYYCGISGYPTLFVVSPDSHFLTYASGQLSLDHFYEILDYSKQLES